MFISFEKFSRLGDVLHREINQIIFAHVRSPLASVYERHKENFRLDSSEKLFFKYLLQTGSGLHADLCV